jgi:hypothetical protein
MRSKTLASSDIEQEGMTRESGPDAKHQPPFTP